MRTTSAWRAYLVIGMLAAAGHVLLGPTSPLTSVAFLIVAASGPIAMCVGIVRRPRRAPWLLMLAGITLMFAGDALWAWYREIANVDPFPSLADALYLPGYPCIALGLLWLVHDHRRATARESLIDATIIATGCGVVSWVFLVAPYVGDSDLGLAERVVSASYPLMDILLIAVVMRLAFARGAARLSDVLLGLGLIALLVADTYLAVLELTVDYDWNAAPELLWLATYVLFGAAALMPARTVVDDGEPVGAWLAGFPRLRLPLLTTASLMAPAVLVWHALQVRSVDLFVIAVGSALLFLLVLTRVFGLVRQVEAQAAAVRLLATADPLTGLPNRRHWEEQVPQVLALAGRTGHQVCIAMLDVDFFKRYNDEHGHHAGDTLLRQSASAWRDQLRTADVLARIGGDEFALALPDCSLERAAEVVQRLRDVSADTAAFSCGVAQWDGSEGQRTLMIRADNALYAAKAAGRDRTTLADQAAAVTAGG